MARIPPEKGIVLRISNELAILGQTEDSHYPKWCYDWISIWIIRIVNGYLYEQFLSLFQVTKHHRDLLIRYVL